MAKFTFKSPAVETLRGTAYFSLEASSKKQALELLKADPWTYFDDFSESDGGTDFDESGPDFESLD